MSGSNSPSSPILKKGVDGPAPKAQPEDTADDTMALNPGDQPVQFVSGQNADARVEIGDSGPPKFVGLGKEELMKYANDPFWVRLRWILFVCFWLLWIAMLAGAIIIIVKAPQCANKTTGPNAGPYYELAVEDFTRDGKFSGIEAEIPFLQKMNIKSVMVTKALASQDGAVTNFKETDLNRGSMQQFESVIKKLKEMGIAVIMQFVPNHSSDQHEWFGSKKDFYIRVPKTTESTWASQLSLNVSGSAWKDDPNFSDSKYLRQFRENEPDLNLRNEDVIKELNSALAFWYSKGVDGFLFSSVSYLLEDLNRLTVQAATINQGNADIVKQLLDNSTEEWKKYNNESNREGPFALLEVDNMRTDKSIGYYGANTAIVNTELAKLEPAFGSEDLKKVIDGTITKVSKYTLHWRIGSPQLGRAAKKFGSDRAAVLALVAASARGHYVHYYGDEFGSADSDAKFSDLKSNVAAAGTASQTFFEELLDASSKFNHTEVGAGETKIVAHVHGVSNNFVMKRQNTQNKYIIVANLGEAEHEVDFEELREALDVTVLVRTPNAQAKYSKNARLTVGKVTLPAAGGLLLRLEQPEKPAE